MNEGEMVFLVREPRNPYDPNAIWHWSYGSQRGKGRGGWRGRQRGKRGKRRAVLPILTLTPTLTLTLTLILTLTLTLQGIPSPLLNSAGILVWLSLVKKALLWSQRCTCGVHVRNNNLGQP
jgi:hypothetical protein